MAEGDRVDAAVAQLRREADTELVFSVLEDVGVEAILLKGVAFARTLYDPGEARPSADVDVLVAGTDVRRALDALGAAGFADLPLHPGAVLRGRHAAEVRKGTCFVDLHHTIVGVGAPPEDVWKAFRGGARSMRIRTREVNIPSPACLALHAALHASWSDHAEERPWEDVRRAAVRLDPGTWAEAHTLAVSLDAVPGFVAGLRRSPEGREVLALLGRAPGLRLRQEVLMQLPPTVAHRLLRASTMTPLEAIRFLYDELMPPRARLEWAAGEERASRARLVRRRLGYARRRLPSAVGETVAGLVKARRQYRRR